MRLGRASTRFMASSGLLLGAVVASGGPSGGPPVAASGPASQNTADPAAAGRLAELDAALAEQRYTLVLEKLRATDAASRNTPAFQWRAAQAYFCLGTIIGDAELRSVPDGRAGQFVEHWLLVERQAGPDRFLCCPPESALFSLRQALDAGLEEPAAHVLHARIWQRLGRPQIGLGILKARAAVLLAHPDDSTLTAFSDLALDAGALSDYLRYERRRAHLRPEQHDEIMFHACLTLAERYSRAGEARLYVEWLERAARIRPNDADVLLRLADAEWSLGRTEEARPLYRRLLSISPNHAERGRILEHLAQADTAPSER